MIDEPAGTLNIPEQSKPRVVIHAGASVRVACRRGSERNDGVANYGDIDTIPAGIPAVWEVYGRGRSLVIGISQILLNMVLETSESQFRGAELVCCPRNT